MNNKSKSLTAVLNFKMRKLRNLAQKKLKGTIMKIKSLIRSMQASEGHNIPKYISYLERGKKGRKREKSWMLGNSSTENYWRTGEREQSSIMFFFCLVTHLCPLVTKHSLDSWPINCSLPNIDQTFCKATKRSFLLQVPTSVQGYLNIIYCTCILTW